MIASLQPQPAIPSHGQFRLVFNCTRTNGRTEKTLRLKRQRNSSRLVKRPTKVALCHMRLEISAVHLLQTLLQEGCVPIPANKYCTWSVPRTGGSAPVLCRPTSASPIMPFVYLCFLVACTQLPVTERSCSPG